MLQFKKIELEDRSLLENKLKRINCNMLNYNFVVQYIYSNAINFQYAIESDFLFIKLHNDNREEQFLRPISICEENIHIEEALYLIKNEAFAVGDTFTITQFCEKNAPLLIDWADKLTKTEPIDYEFYPVRDEYEYLYLSENLVKLEGHILKPKRNRVHAFHRNYKLTVEPISETNIGEVIKFGRQWTDIKFEQTKMVRLHIEKMALHEALHHFFELNLEGILIRADDQFAAFTLGCPLNEDTFLVLFENADTQFIGAYSVVNQEFAKIIAPRYPYINRAEDCGVEGLRRAKMAYEPHTLNKVYHLDVFKIKN